jgi:hypothetical protein
MVRILLPLTLLALTACNAAAPSAFQPTPNRLNAASAIGTQGVKESRFAFNGDRTELTGTVIYDNGETKLFTTLRRPTTGSSVTAETSVLQNGSLQRKYATQPAEATFVIRLAANSGLADVHRELQERYRLAGLY